MNPAKTTNNTRRVVVAGDVTMDWNLARRRLDPAGVVWNADDCTEVYGQLGGAALLGDLIAELAETLGAENLQVEVDRAPAPESETLPGDPRLDHSYAIWSRFPLQQRRSAKTVWRVEEFLGLDRARDLDGLEPSARRRPADPPDADLVILDDANLGFRDEPELLAEGAGARPQKPARPQRPGCCSRWPARSRTGELWRKLLRTAPSA